LDLPVQVTPWLQLFSVLSGTSSLLGRRLPGGQQVAPGGVPAQHAPEHRGRFSPREERGALRRGGDWFSPVGCGTATAMLSCSGSGMADGSRRLRAESARAKEEKKKKRTIVFLRKQSQLRTIYFQLYSELKNTIYEASLLLFHKIVKTCILQN
jgi:hypothetical protein